MVAKRVYRKKNAGKGILTDLAKTAVKSVANKGIEMGAEYLKDKVSGMGNIRFANTRRIKGRKAPELKPTAVGSLATQKKTFGGGALYPAGMGIAPYKKLPMQPC